MRPERTAAPLNTEAERLVALGQVAGELMHDLANLVSVIRGRATVALGDARAGRLPISEMERLNEATDELGSMLRDVVEALHDQPIPPGLRFDPREVAERAIRRFLEASPPLRIQLDSSIPAAVAISGRASFLSRAITNLLANAARYARSEVRLSLATHRRADVTCIVVAVEDDGAGIPEADVEGMFQPLVRGEGGGTGLGLSSVVWAVRHLGGEVEYRTGSTLGGACFEILLPIAAPSRPPVRIPVATLRDCRVLLIEDDPVVRGALLRLLARVGAEASSLPPTHDTVDTLLPELLGSMPDIILLDLRLGWRGGVDVWKTIDAHLPALARRVIFLSGLAPGDPEWEAARQTGRRVLSKPLDLEELADAVVATIGES